MIDCMPKTLTAFFELPPKLYYSKNPVNMIKATLFRFNQFKTTDMWDLYRHNMRIQHLSELAVLGDMFVL